MLILALLWSFDTGGLPAAVDILTIKDMAIAAATAGSTSSARNPMPLSAVIVDDEQLARDELAYLLNNLDDVNVVAQRNNLPASLPLTPQHNPDLTVPHS